jgi:hypothetical protein
VIRCELFNKILNESCVSNLLIVVTELKIVSKYFVRVRFLRASFRACRVFAVADLHVRNVEGPFLFAVKL